MKLSPLAQAGLIPVLTLAGVLLGGAVLTDDGQELAPVQATPPEATNALPAPVSAATSPTNVEATNGPLEVPLIAPVPSDAAAPQSPSLEPAKPPVELSDRLDAVVKLAHSGVEDAVILAFIENSTSPFNPTPDQIVYMTDVGLSDAVITALVNHRGIQSAAPPDTPMAVAPPPPYIPPGEPDQPAGPVEATYNPEPPAGYSEPPVVDYGTPPPVEDPYFYPALAPYGTWVQVADYGYCWQPTVGVIHGGWQPYCDHGHWLYTDCGWYWQSDYSWGWAPFHYGRWFRHPHYGWCWRPDSVWAPAWVAWRYTDSHCGWAPLPPGAHYHEGAGFTYYGAHVGANFTFGLHQNAWTFVRLGEMHEREVWRHRVPPNERALVYTHSRAVSNYAYDHHTIVNKGLEPARVPGFAGGEVRKVTVRDVPERAAGTIRPDRLHLEGSQLVVYRPKPPPVAPPQAPKPGESTAARTVASRPVNTSISGNPAGAGAGAGSFATRSRSETLAPTAGPANPPVGPTTGFAAARTQPARPQAAASTPTWGQARSIPEGTAPSWQRSAAPAPVAAAPAVRQEIRREVPAPATTVAPEKYNAPVEAQRPVFSGNAPAVRSAPWTAPEMNTRQGYTAPQATHAAPSYNPPPGPVRLAPSAPSYSPAPVQARPVQPMPSYAAPVSRPAPQAVPAPAASSNRRQN